MSSEKRGLALLLTLSVGGIIGLLGLRFHWFDYFASLFTGLFPKHNLITNPGKSASKTTSVTGGGTISEKKEQTGEEEEEEEEDDDEDEEDQEEDKKEANVDTSSTDVSNAKENEKKSEEPELRQQYDDVTRMARKLVEGSLLSV
jgi:hypothetical protein